MSEQEINRYLSTLSMEQLLTLFEVGVRHNHYCPCECHCFDEYPDHISYFDVKRFILSDFKSLMNYGG
jgi:hypothetical protein